MHRFAVYLSGDPALADDITAETFLRAWTSAAPIRTATVKAYLFTIARNVYLHELRRRARLVEVGDRVPSSAPTQQDRALGTSVNALKVRVHRARLKLAALVPERRHASAARIVLARPPGLCPHGPGERLACVAAPRGLARAEPDLEAVAFDRIRRFVRRRANVLGFAIAFSVMPFSFAFDGSHVRWMMLRDSPAATGAFWIAGVVLWTLYAFMERRVRSDA